MNLYLSGFEHAIPIDRGCVTTLEIHNRVLFERVCRSLMLNVGDNAVEPYELCDDEGEHMRSRGALLVIPSPLTLPWSDKELGGAVIQRVMDLLLEQSDIRSSLESCHNELASHAARLALQLQSDYCFDYEWDAPRYMRSFGFGVEYDNSDSTFEKCMKFLALAHDVRFAKPLVFCGFKHFFSDNELIQLFEQVFLLNLRVLLVESEPGDRSSQHEQKYTIDQHFLEL